ncbi:substrate-binding domain-containing protein [Salegentibacter sp. F188]|jgi:ABC-type sugar transport system substrate-binding protein/DNA-binding response OmpR family regulator/nitrogen-specific signal transduction histidine kinase|uniref:histidine kinase n=1 Tax=Autumnicola patrickiae TaxID=3075591 RepID=A0ABU3E375_9FLAO|nr:substrate-binding domain-containing protein [Salegentibacter sp. F188]MDT0690427.1 substrate-binding domain-containing protein [Salegentibacter sp. F188]
MKFIIKLLLILIFCGLTSCSTNDKRESYLIGFSQAMTTDNWRKEMNKSMLVETSMHPDLKLEVKDAKNDVQRQIEQIDEFISKGVDVLIVSPIQSVPITPVIEKAMDSGIPTIIIDRKIEGRNFTAYIGANSTEIGRNAAKYIISHAQDSTKVIEITGLQGSSPAYDRSAGFRQTLDSIASIKISHTINGDWEKASIKKTLNKLLLSGLTPDYIFAHNDRMALGAWEVAKSKNLQDRIKIIGVDGLFGPSGGIQLVKDKVLDATVLYPSGGAEAIKLASLLLQGKNVNKNNILNTVIIDSVNVDIMQNQFNKMNEQQNDIEQQQRVIEEQVATYKSQRNLVKMMIGLLILLLILIVWAVYLVIKLKKSKKGLESKNQKILDQRNKIEEFAEKLKISNEGKINFFTALSHEFKTPLTLITTSIESISESTNQNLKGFNYETKLIINNSRRLLRLINELLDFRKLESGSFRIKPVKTNIYNFLQNIYTDFNPEAIKKSITLQLHSHDKDVELFIDQDMMDKVFFNILSNSFKFTPRNGQILLTMEDVAEDFVLIKVKDSGTGIPKNELKKIFDPFIQASNNNKSSSGLGLYITRQFVELHKGKISVSSHQGAEFSVLLPKGKEHLKEYNPGGVSSEMLSQNSNVHFQETVLENESLSQLKHGNAEKMLIIEDNPDLSHLLKKKFRADYLVYLSDGTDGIEKALEIIPDVIICDINLPEKNGFEICAALKNDLRTSHIPTIILTALSTGESEIKAMKAGADSFVTKPFNLSILKESLRAVLYNREKLRYYYTNRIDKVEDEKFDNSEQQFLRDLNRIIDKNIENAEFNVEYLAAQLNISRVQLYRKVKGILGITISEYINSQRLSKAKQLLQDSDLNISEIAYMVGYSSPGYFSTSFKNKYGFSPKQFKS